MWWPGTRSPPAATANGRRSPHSVQTTIQASQRNPQDLSRESPIRVHHAVTVGLEGVTDSRVLPLGTRDCREGVTTSDLVESPASEAGEEGDADLIEVGPRAG
jgi:hypothetical protein